MGLFGRWWCPAIALVSVVLVSYCRRMAIFKSQVLTQASGSVGGMTYTRTSSGMTIRARSMPVNPRTERQQVMRNAFSTLSTAWVETLTEEQRIGWTDYAKNVSVKNKLGDSIHISGIAMFNRCNSPRLQLEAVAPGFVTGMILNAPTIFDTGESVTGGAITQDGTTPFAVSFDWTGPTGGVGDAVVIYVSKPQNESINYFEGPYQFNQFTSPSGGPIALVPNPTWVQGQVIHVRVRILYSDGRLSPDTIYRFKLAATPV